MKSAEWDKWWNTSLEGQRFNPRYSSSKRPSSEEASNLSVVIDKNCNDNTPLGLAVTSKGVFSRCPSDRVPFLTLPFAVTDS